MRALEAVLRAAGAPPRLVKRQIPDSPARGEVLVAMLRAPVNPADLLVLDGRYGLAQDFPAVAGAEGVGEVLASGPGATKFRPGTRVLPLTRGNWCSHRLLPQEDLVHVPDGLDLNLAAIARINPATAWHLLALRHAHAPGADDRPVLVNGARSMVAHFVRHFGRRQGLDVIGIGRGASDADRAILADDEHLEDQLSSLGLATPLLALDCVAGDATGRLAALIGQGGCVIVYGHLSGEQCRVPSTLLTSRGLIVQGFSLRPHEEVVGPFGRNRAFAAIFDALQYCPMPPVRACVPLAALADAIALARQGGPGRVMLALGEGGHRSCVG